MKLNEMKNAMSGIPSGFSGERMNWKDVNDTFTISKAAIMEHDKIDKNGLTVCYKNGPRTGMPIPDRQIVLELNLAESGKKAVVRTNSPRLTSLYSGDLGREPDEINRFGDRVFIVEAPEGVMKFVPSKQSGPVNGKDTTWDVADLAEAD